MITGTHNTKIYHEALESPVTCQKERKKRGKRGEEEREGERREKELGRTIFKTISRYKFSWTKFKNNSANLTMPVLSFECF